MGSCGKTLVTRTQGTKIATEELKGRVLELNLADLNNDEDQSYKKIKLCIEEVQGKNCLTDFHGMDLTRDKQMSLIRKLHTLIEVQLRDLVKKLIPESIGKEIEKHTQGIFPLKDVLIRKVKILKKPKFDITKLMEQHTDSGDHDAGAAFGRPEDDTAQNLITAGMKDEEEE